MVDFPATLHTSSNHISRRFMQSPLWRPKFRRLSQLGPQNLHYLVFFFEFLYTFGHLILLLHPHLLCNLGKWETEKGFFTCQGWEHFQELLQSPYKISTVGYFTLFQKIKKNNQSTLKFSRSRNKNCRVVTSPKNEWTNLLFYSDDLEILETRILISRFKYFRVVSIEKQIHSFVFGRSLLLHNCV